MTAATLDVVQRRYTRLAPVYERTLGERLLYSYARRRAIDGLRLSPGAVVVDVACGTGLNLQLLRDRVGPTGTVIGVDLTRGMLARAQARIDRAGWTNVRLLELDATKIRRDDLEHSVDLPADRRVDAVLCTLGLSVIPDWETAWQRMLDLARPGGRVGVMDGAAAPGPAALRPVTAAICRFYAAAPTRDPWRLAERDLTDVERCSFASGFVQAAAGSVPYE